MRWPRSTWAFCTCQLRHQLDLVAFREGGAVKQPISAPGQKMSWYPPFSPSSSTGTRNLCTEFSFQSWPKNHMWWNKGRWSPLVFPLQLNTAGKQAFRENQSIHYIFLHCELQIRAEAEISEAPSSRPSPPDPNHHGTPCGKRHKPLN